MTTGLVNMHIDRLIADLAIFEWLLKTGFTVTTTVMFWLPNIFQHGILQRNYRKMTIKRSFSNEFFVKLYGYNIVHL